jgi:hypothetical protein
MCGNDIERDDKSVTLFEAPSRADRSHSVAIADLRARIV